MMVIISPAKKMNVDTDSFGIGGLPGFMEDTRVLMEAVKSLPLTEAKTLWNAMTNLPG